MSHVVSMEEAVAKMVHISRLEVEVSVLHGLPFVDFSVA
jgi:hypothetical protein